MRPNKAKLCYEILSAHLDVREYSSSKKYLAFESDSISKVLADFGHALSEAISLDDGEDDFASCEMVQYMLQNAKVDSSGMKIVVYFPSIPFLVSDKDAEEDSDADGDDEDEDSEDEDDEDDPDSVA